MSQFPSVLFVQATDAAAYPPIINASILFAEAGWHVTVLTAPIAGSRLRLEEHPRVALAQVEERPSHVLTPKNYLNYCARAITLAWQLKPQVIYASDPFGALPGIISAKMTGARLVYHEHDSPSTGKDLNGLVRWARWAAARSAAIVVFPNAARAQFAQEDLRFPSERLQIVWNMPRRSEVLGSQPRGKGPLVLYYHGSITPDRLPVTVIEAAGHFKGEVVLQIAGYEAPSATGYVESLKRRAAAVGVENAVTHLGEIPQRQELLKNAARADIGLALVPVHCQDFNMRFMTGASNKPFDYMAAGLPLLVTDLPEWRKMFVDPGYGRACDPHDKDSVIKALSWYLQHPMQREVIAKRNQAAICAELNYDLGFKPVLNRLNAILLDRSNQFLFPECT